MIFDRLVENGTCSDRKVGAPGDALELEDERSLHASSSPRPRGIAERRARPGLPSRALPADCLPPAARSGFGDARDDAIEICEDLFLRDAKYTPPERAERAVARGIAALPPLVAPAVNLDDEADLGASEVDDEVANDELTAKGKSGLRPGELSPEPVLRARWSEAQDRKSVV